MNEESWTGACARRGLAASVGAALLLGGALSSAKEGFESPPTFRASKILPAALLSGPNHDVGEQVRNDGFMNHYTISSRFGNFTAASDAELRIRVDEVNAIARLDEVSRHEQFASGVVKAGKDVLASATGVITDPVDTIKETGEGFMEILGSAGRTITGRGEGGVEDTIGYSRAKRQYAAAFGVDPYSTNPVLQEHLSRVSQAGYVGDFGAGAALGLASGGAGIALSSAGHMQSLRELVRDKSPQELREINQEKLRAIGVDHFLIDRFLGNDSFSPSYQTAFVDSLEQLDGVDGLGEFIEMAARARGEDDAMFRVRQARMYANYHKSVKRLRGAVRISGLVGVAFRTAGGTVVVNAPADYVARTSKLADYMDAATSVGGATGASPKQLWVAGRMSPTASKWFAANGWTTQASAQKRLLPD